MHLTHASLVLFLSIKTDGHLKAMNGAFSEVKPIEKLPQKGERASERVRVVGWWLLVVVVGE